MKNKFIAIIIFITFISCSSEKTEKIYNDSSCVYFDRGGGATISVCTDEVTIEIVEEQ